jgi:glucoamylase
MGEGDRDLGEAPSSRDSEPLVDWMERQYSLSATKMLRAVSATDLVKDRKSFSQLIRPARGSVLASPEMASYDPDPDYFFHWHRDAAIVFDALRLVIADRTLGLGALEHFKDFVEFNLKLGALDGRALLSHGDIRHGVDPAFLQFVRPDAELREISGDRVFGETRVNPDGTLDILKWSRPQSDGPALRVLTVLRFLRLETVQHSSIMPAARQLLERDIGFICRHWNEPSFDIWEEELGFHYYTRLVQQTALANAAIWMQTVGDMETARICHEVSDNISGVLDSHWDPGQGFYLSRVGVAAEATASLGKQLDIATILAVLHADKRQGVHSILDPKIQATLKHLEDLFATTYSINLDSLPGRGPALGRYADDHYYSGGAYFFSTLAAAQLYFQFAEAVATGARVLVTPENKDMLLAVNSNVNAPLPALLNQPAPRTEAFNALLKCGDRFMETVRAYTPASGDLSEQFDHVSGAQTSAKNLTWSYAAFITAFASRKAALQVNSMG